MANEENIYEKDHSVDTLINNITDILKEYSEKWRTLGTDLLLRRAEITDMTVRIIELEYEKYKKAERSIINNNYEELYCTHCDSQRCGDNPPETCPYREERERGYNERIY